MFLCLPSPFTKISKRRSKRRHSTQSSLKHLLPGNHKATGSFSPKLSALKWRRRRRGGGGGMAQHMSPPPQYTPPDVVETDHDEEGGVPLPQDMLIGYGSGTLGENHIHGDSTQGNGENSDLGGLLLQLAGHWNKMGGEEGGAQEREQIGQQGGTGEGPSSIHQAAGSPGSSQPGTSSANQESLATYQPTPGILEAVQQGGAGTVDPDLPSGPQQHLQDIALQVLDSGPANDIGAGQDSTETGNEVTDAAPSHGQMPQNVAFHSESLDFTAFQLDTTLPDAVLHSEPTPIHPTPSNGVASQVVPPPPPLQTEEEVLPMQVGEPGSGETLPAGQHLFTDPTPLLADYGATPENVIGNVSHRNALMPSIHDTFFLWRSFWRNEVPGYPYISKLAEDRRFEARPAKITPSHMTKTGMDRQGIHWSRYQVTPAQARKVRHMTYKNHTNTDGNHVRLDEHWGYEAYKIDFSTPSAPRLTQTSSPFFTFRETTTTLIPRWSHYQLRHNIATTSQTALYYYNHALPIPGMETLNSPFHNPKDWSVRCYNPISGTNIPVIVPSKLSTRETPGERTLHGISALAADCGVLVVGSVYGVYGLRSLATPHDALSTTGNINPPLPPGQAEISRDDLSVNHVYTTYARSSALPFALTSPAEQNVVPGADARAIFSSNDCRVRTLDCATLQWLDSGHEYENAVNCACSSPDGRLRLLVADDTTPVVTDAASGEVVWRLHGHADQAFACAWAGDGVTMATAAQDGLVMVWDARMCGAGGGGGGYGRWTPSSAESFSGVIDRTAALASIPAEQSCVRALHFSPVGGGKPVLVAAEASDFVHVIDCASVGGLESMQTIEFFGDVAGVAVSPDGGTLWVGNADRDFGGLMKFERWDGGYGVGGYDSYEGGKDKGKAKSKGQGKEKEGGKGRLRREDLRELVELVFEDEEDGEDVMRRKEIENEYNIGDWRLSDAIDEDVEVPAGMAGGGSMGVRGTMRRGLGVEELLV